MKPFLRLFIATIILNFGSTSNVKCQITLEQDYDTSSQRLKYVNFQINGEKYVRLNYPRQLGPSWYNPYDRRIDIYNLNHSLWKTIPLNGINFHPDSINASYGILYVSDSLFNQDPLVEFLFTIATGPLPHFETYIYDENLNLIFSDTIAGPWFSYMEIPQTYLPIVNTSLGTKMIISSGYPDFLSRVYGLPGQLPMSTADQFNGFNKEESSMILYPNPTTDFTTVQYALPINIDRADLIIYNMLGNQVKSYKIDRTFHDLKLSTRDLPNGTYYFQIQAGNDVIQGKRLIKIN